MSGFRPLVWFEKCFAVFTLVLYAEAFASHLLVPETGPLTTSELRYLWIPAYFITIGLLLPRWREVLELLWANWHITGLVVLCALSSLWSVDWDVTFRRAVALIATTLFGFYLVARFTAGERLRLLCWAILVIAVGSVIFALWFPAYGVMSHTHIGAWSGAYEQKNKLGAMMALGVAAFMTHVLIYRQYRMVNLAGASLCFFIILMSTSKTSLLAAIMFVSILLWVAAFYWHMALGVLISYLAAMIGTALAGVILVDPEILLDLLGRDATLTGRTDIWEAALEQIRLRPLLGWGYGAFWEVPEGPAWHVRKAAQWLVTSAHNGWLELWLSIGIIGMSLFGISFVVAFSRALRAVARHERETGGWAVGFLTLFLVMSLSESTILQQNNIDWALYVATVASVYRRKEEAGAPAPRHFAGLDIDTATPMTKPAFDWDAAKRANNYADADPPRPAKPIFVWR